jgi:hypothetical protein
MRLMILHLVPSGAHVAASGMSGPRVQRGGILIAPSSLMVSPLSIGFSAMC